MDLGTDKVHQYLLDIATGKLMPRGEVGLIFAALGKSLGVLGNGLFSSIVMMVVVTTLATPPLLKLALGTSSDRSSSETP